MQPKHLLAAAAAMLPVDWVAIGERTVYVRAAPPWDTLAAHAFAVAAVATRPAVGGGLFVFFD